MEGRSIDELLVFENVFFNLIYKVNENNIILYMLVKYRLIIFFK